MLYFFHLRDGTDTLLDPEGRSLPDVPSIAVAALREARAIISLDAVDGIIKLGQRIDVENGDGHVLHTQEFRDAIRFIG
ncbi:MAG TPA: hypothetical protein VF695_11955 [Sphingomonas sp.]|jgi:hypothetical protein